MFIPAKLPAGCRLSASYIKAYFPDAYPDVLKILALTAPFVNDELIVTLSLSPPSSAMSEGI